MSLFFAGTENKCFYFLSRNGLRETVLWKITVFAIAWIELWNFNRSWSILVMSMSTRELGFLFGGQIFFSTHKIIICIRCGWKFLKFIPTYEPMINTGSFKTRFYIEGRAGKLEPFPFPIANLLYLLKFVISLRNYSSEHVKERLL